MLKILQKSKFHVMWNILKSVQIRFSALIPKENFFYVYGKINKISSSGLVELSEKSIDHSA